MYMGRAINASHPLLDDDDVLGDIGKQIVQVVYVVPFISVFIILFILSVIVILLCLCEYDETGEDMEENQESPISFMDKFKAKLKETKKTGKEFRSKLTNNLQVQANLAAVTFLCCVFTTYTFALDTISLVQENNANLPEYYHKKSYGFYKITFVFTLISFFFGFIGIIWLVFVWFYNLFMCCSNPCGKKKREVYLPMLLCIASAILSLSFHFQNILIAWSTDPFYASRIALFYGIITFYYFTSIKYGYSFPLKILRRDEDSNNCHHWNTCELISVVISLFITLCLCSFIIIPVVLFVIHVPINNSIEQSLTGITTIFNGTVILIGGFIAYRVSIQYFGNPFSMEDALKNAMNEIEKTPFDPDDILNWSKLSEEKRMTEVMKAFIYRKTKKGPPYKQDSNQEHSNADGTRF